MLAKINDRKTHGFSILELVVIVSVIAGMSAFYMQTTARAKAKAKQIRCVSNLRQVGMAFEIFAQEHGAQYPMNVPFRQGGSKEFVPTLDAYPHFQVLSNTLELPPVLLCPADGLRQKAANWGTLSNEHISFFIGLDASPGKSDDILSGDRNGTNQIITYGIALRMTVNDAAEWSNSTHGNEGNILFSDGRVEQLNNRQLNDALKLHGQRR